MSIQRVGNEITRMKGNFPPAFYPTASAFSLSTLICPFVVQPQFRSLLSQHPKLPSFSLPLLELCIHIFHFFTENHSQTAAQSL